MLEKVSFETELYQYHDVLVELALFNGMSSRCVYYSGGDNAV